MTDEDEKLTFACGNLTLPLLILLLLIIFMLPLLPMLILLLILDAPLVGLSLLGIRPASI